MYLKSCKSLIKYKCFICSYVILPSVTGVYSLFVKICALTAPSCDNCLDLPAFFEPEATPSFLALAVHHKLLRNKLSLAWNQQL